MTTMEFYIGLVHNEAWHILIKLSYGLNESEQNNSTCETDHGFILLNPCEIIQNSAVQPK